MRNDYNSDVFKKLLDKLQQESWQLELLISGFAIFGLFSLTEVIMDAGAAAKMNGNIYLLNVYGVGIMSSYVLLFNLLLHVILRGIWIGAIGLRYVSGDIDFKLLNYSEKFTSYLKRKIVSFDKYISSLENFCSVLFALSFLMVFYLISIFLIAFIFAIGAYFIDLLKAPYPVIHNIFKIIYSVIFSIGILLVFFDFVTQGLLKKKKWVSKIYFPVYWFFSWITLSFIYRPLVYNFLDNKYGKRIIYALVPIYIILITATSLNFSNSNFFNEKTNSSEYLIDSENYQDEFEEKDYTKTASIPSKVINTSYLNIFLAHNKGIEDLVFSLNDSLKPKKDTRGIHFGGISFENKKTIQRKKDSIFKATKMYLKTINNVYKINIDTLEINTDFIASRTKNIQLGYETFIKLDSSITEGRHILTIKHLIQQKNDSVKSMNKQKQDSSRILIKIPFWYYPD